MYMNFSGYTDIVVASARLVGLTLPENFDRPYLARNPIDYWNRWHISLTHWIRDYVFMTSYKEAIARFPKAAKPLGYALLFFALFLSGVWHGTTSAFAVFGAIHGAGVAANQAYADWLRKRLGRDRLKAYQADGRIRWVARVLTMHFIGFAFLFFGLGTPGALGALGRIGRWIVSGPYPAPGWASVAALGVFAAILLALAKAEAIGARLLALRARLAAGERSVYALVLAETVAVALALVLLWGLEKEPVVAYMRF
jgi:hypothetical protein